MPTFKKADEAVYQNGADILARYDSHKPLIDLKVRVDYIFAHADLDENGVPTGDALKHHGVRALGIAKILPLKERVMGRGDAEIMLDGDWWEAATAEQRDAVLDHELHHLTIKTDKNRKATYDDIGRPKLRMRKHDFDFGWFSIIAVRHGLNSQECIQARALMDGAGQYYWPQLETTMETIQMQRALHDNQTSHDSGDHVRTDITVDGKTFENVDLDKAAKKLKSKK